MTEQSSDVVRTHTGQAHRGDVVQHHHAPAAAAGTAQVFASVFVPLPKGASSMGGGRRATSVCYAADGKPYSPPA